LILTLARGHYCPKGNQQPVLGGAYQHEPTGRGAARRVACTLYIMEVLAIRSLPKSRASRRSKSRGLALAAISAGFLMITLDATIVNVALGAIGSDLGGAASTAQWIVDGYTVAFASLLLLAGSLADRIGVRRGFVVGLAVFVVASAACALANSVAFLIAARVAQGIGAAWLMPCSLALIAHTYTEPQARRRALAVWGAVSGIGLASGPLVGGILVTSVGWRAIFFANVPIGLIAGWLLLRHAEETPRQRRSFDLPGQVLAMVSLAALTAGFINAGAHGWATELTLTLVVGGSVAAAAFVLLERTVRSPLIDPGIFRDATFTTAVAIGFLFNFCLYGSIFCLALGLERLRGLDALATGLALLPMTAATAVMALLAGRLVPRLGEWPVLVAGLTCGAAGATLVALSARSGNVGLLLVATVPIGFTALAMPAMTGLAMRRSARFGLGLSAGVFNTSRQAGGALGVAVLGALLTAGSSVSLRPAFVLTACTYAVAVALAAVARKRDHAYID
jgi:DHA2 family methylenomycin A resistance protein-like MFS transporter